jgi:transcription factor C subunit 7
LLGVDPPIDQVYSSPYYRCLQTISPFISEHNAGRNKASKLNIRVEPGLSEWYGRAHFEHPTSAPLNDLSVLFADLDANYVSSAAPHRHGESISQLYERIAACIQAIILRSDQEGKKAVLICTHAAVVIALGRILTGKVPEDVSVGDFAAFTCGLSVYRRQRVGEDRSIIAAGHGAAPIGDHIQQNANLQDAMQVLDPRSPASDPGEPARPRLERGRGLSLTSYWTCEANSDCSFLRGGEERGW